MCVVWQALLMELALLMEEKTFEIDAVVYDKGQHLDTMYVVTSGHIVIETAPGVFVTLFGPGDFFGEFALFDTDDVCEHQVKCTSNATCLAFKKDDKTTSAMSSNMKDTIEHMSVNFKSVLISALQKFESLESSFHVSPLCNFEHEAVFAVDIMLGFFAFANAGVVLDGPLGTMSIVIAASLFFGKTLGIFCAGAVAHVCFGRWAPLPTGVNLKDLFCVGMTASIGLTVALFIAGEAYVDHPTLMRDANLGALLSMFFCVPCMIMGKIMGTWAGDGSEEISGGAHEAMEMMEAAERKKHALQDATQAAELAADHAILVAEVNELSDAQVREVFMRVVGDFSNLVEQMQPDVLAHKPSHVLNSMLFDTLEEVKDSVIKLEKVSPIAAAAKAKADAAWAAGVDETE